MPTVTALIASLSREAAGAIERTVNAMPEEKVSWQPLGEGRTALHQVVECGAINLSTPRILKERVFPDFESGWMERFRAENDTREKALDLLRRGTDAFVAAVEAFPAGDLDQTIDLPFGGGMTKTFAEFMMMAYWNMTYHLGQINYLQTLYGDHEMH